MEVIIEAVSDVTSLMSEVFAVMTSNALLTFFVASGLLTTGITVFKRMRGAAR